MESFLAALDWERGQLHPLADDASFRRYFRLVGHDRRAVFMDAPPPLEDVQAFARLSRHLLGLGFSAPAILAEDDKHGFLLLEDFGDATFSRLLAAGADEEALYALAVDVLIDLHSRPPAETVPAWLPPYDNAALLEEAFLLADWYVPAVCGAALSERARAAYTTAWIEVLEPVTAQPPTLVMRDFHVDNLMRLAGRKGLTACGLLDFQDAVAGHPAYDLMSLLEDARRDIAPALKTAMAARYRAGRPNLAASEASDRAFCEAFTTLAAQRHAKVIGIFTRLAVRDGKPAYLRHIPRVWRLLTAALADPVLDPVRAWMDSHIPEGDRRIPECGATAP